MIIWSDDLAKAGCRHKSARGTLPRPPGLLHAYERMAPSRRFVPAPHLARDIDWRSRRWQIAFALATATGFENAQTSVHVTRALGGDAHAGINQGKTPPSRAFMRQEASVDAGPFNNSVRANSCSQATPRIRDARDQKIYSKDRSFPWCLFAPDHKWKRCQA